MARYLNKPCVDITIKSVSIARKKGDELGGTWQTFVVVQGAALDEDGKELEGIHKKFNIGPPGPSDWDADTFEADIVAVASVIKAKYGQVLAFYTTP